MVHLPLPAPIQNSRGACSAQLLSPYASYPRIALSTSSIFIHLEYSNHYASLGAPRPQATCVYFLLCSRVYESMTVSTVGENSQPRNEAFSKIGVSNSMNGQLKHRKKCTSNFRKKPLYKHKIYWIKFLLKLNLIHILLDLKFFRL